MAPLDEKTRIKYLQELGYGSVKAFQLAVMYPQWVDDKYGPQTDNALRTAWNVHLYCKDFKTTEFRCECGGRYCGGYPDYMKPSELMHIQTIRDHYGRPITITSGLRCKGWNRHLNGSVENSGHLTGLALDFYQAGVTDTVANRKASMKYIRALPNHKFSYGAYMNGTDGIYRKASYMGNAMHTECSNTTPSTPDGKLNVDGVAGGCTIIRIQTVFGMSVKDGVISGQNKSLGKFYPSVTAVQYGKGGSATVKRLQKWAGATQDGVWGQGTSKALQHKLSSEGYNAGTEDGIFGSGSVRAFQKWLNDHDKPTADTPPTPQPAPTPTIVSKFIDAIKTQYEWSKNQKYGWVSGGPTIANSKKEGTCISLHSVALQRLGILPTKGYFYFNPETKKIAGKSASYVKNHPEIFELFYPNKTVAQLWKEGRIKIGDYVGYGGKNYHSMVFKGFNSKGEAIFDTMGHRRGLNITYPYYAKQKVAMVVRLKG